MKNSYKSEKIYLVNSRDRNPSYYIEKIEPEILASFTPKQLQAIADVIEQAIPQPSPKIVDFRVTVDFIISRFYIVLFVGKDRRKQQRQDVTKGGAIANAIAAIVILVGANLVISAFILLFAYLFKSAIGINFFPAHISETVKQL